MVGHGEMQTNATTAYITHNLLCIISSLSAALGKLTLRVAWTQLSNAFNRCRVKVPTTVGAGRSRQSPGSLAAVGKRQRSRYRRGEDGYVRLSCKDNFTGREMG